jgi:hypothetical protein
VLYVSTPIIDYEMDIAMQTSMKLNSHFALQSVPGFLYSLPNWIPPPVPKRGDTLACEGGGGGPNFDEGEDTLLLYVYYNLSKL